MIKIRVPSDCCGCSACVQKCPHGAIAMRPDRRGFEYPVVDTEKCVECGLCEIVCPMWKGGFERRPVRVYAVKHKDGELRRESASGGAFSLFANSMINQGGVVYGAAFDKNWDVHHIRVSSRDELWRVRGSKYVQSSLDGVLTRVKKDLDSGIQVLFSGLPCQISALRLFLGDHYEGLQTVELVCGGICSPKVWRDYLDEECRRLGISKKQIVKINFRDKTTGWVQYSHCIDYIDNQGNRKKELSLSYWRECENPYMRLFLHGHIFRSSCLSCRFKKGMSGANYAIADYWGIEKNHRDFYDGIGVSLLLQYEDNSAMCELLADAQTIQTSYEDAEWGNPGLEHLARPSAGSRMFFFLHCMFGLSCRRAVVIADLYADIRCRFLQKVRSLKSFLKRAIKKMLGVR